MTTESIKNKLDQLTAKQQGYLFLLQSFTDYRGYLMGTENRLPALKQDIMKMLHIKDYHTINTLLDKLATLDILDYKYDYFYGKEQIVWYINPEYIFKKGVAQPAWDKKMGKALKNISVYVGELFDARKVNAMDLGLLWKCLEYLHPETGVLAENPDETDLNKLKSMTQEKLSEMLGISPNNFRYIIGRMNLLNIEQGEATPVKVFTKAVTGAQTTYKINPQVCWVGKGVPNMVKAPEFVLEANK